MDHEFRQAIRVELSAMLTEILIRKLAGIGDRRVNERHERELRQRLTELRTEGRACVA